MKKPKVVIVYDRVNTFGGAERVLQALHALYPEAPLYTSVFDGSRASWISGWNVASSFLQRFSFLRAHHEKLALLMPLAFESLNLCGFDVVISVASEAAKGVITRPGATHICYLLTPTRYLWSHEKQYEKDFYRGWKKLLLPLHRVSTAYLKRWDVVAAQRPDHIIPISNLVKRRCEQYYGRKTEPVIYPPVDFDFFSKPPRHQAPGTRYYLSVGRLVPYKRVDLAIQACIQLRRRLVIVGRGSDELRLRFLAGSSPYIQFVGYLTDEELLRYYQQCTAFLFPGEEDFGITALEAMAAGKPVVTNRLSGNAEVVEEGKSGIHMHSETVEALVSAISTLEQSHFDAKAIQVQAQTFDIRVFQDKWRKYL